MEIFIERLLLLKRVPFFELLRTDQLHYIAAILESVAWVEGERVFDLGAPGHEMYIIIKGRVGISLSANPEDKFFVAEMGEGDCFGEMGILDDLPRSASAHVLEDTDAFALSKEKLRGLLLSYPELGVGMLRALSRRLRTANDALREVRNRTD